MLNFDYAIFYNGKDFIRIFGLKGMGSGKLAKSGQDHLVAGLEKAGKFNALPAKTPEFNGGVHMAAKRKIPFALLGMVGQ